MIVLFGGLGKAGKVGPEIQRVKEVHVVKGIPV